MAKTIGNRIAPAKFIAFIAVLVVAAPAAVFAIRRLVDDPLRDSLAKGFMIGFDVAASVFLLSCLPLLRVGDQKVMRDHAGSNDANRGVLLIITAAVAAAVLAAVAVETVGGGGAPGAKTKALIVATLFIAWLFTNAIYALHYAHLFAAKKGGVDFPGKAPPGYADFVYFSFTLGMTFQTSDVNVSDKGIRNVVTLHCLGILAFTINVLGG
jgi:uncharacterized membrane protein